MYKINKNIMDIFVGDEFSKFNDNPTSRVTSGRNWLAEGIEVAREEFLWGSYGRDGTEAMDSKLLKDISDSHLLHMIGHLIIRKRPPNLILFLEEARYRSENRIFVPEYDENNNQEDDEHPLLPF